MRFTGTILLFVGTLLLAGSAGAEQNSDTNSSAGSVVRAVFTTTISEREPQDSVVELMNDSGKIMFFTEFKGMSGQTAIHRWEYQGKVMAEVPFQIGAERWRAWSSKNLEPSWIGEWQVTALDESGNELTTRNFEMKTVAPSAPASMR
ncbi:DUF2914 domain-containing protein [Myxococcota bacterium]|nr:DUF2914 domain-containing protein [Myxococcota bacterium]